MWSTVFTEPFQDDIVQAEIFGGVQS